MPSYCSLYLALWYLLLYTKNITAVVSFTTSTETNSTIRSDLQRKEAALRLLDSSNSSNIHDANITRGEDGPIWEFFPVYNPSAPIPRSIIFQSLASAFDWACYVWGTSAAPSSDIFEPDNFYGVQISVESADISTNSSTAQNITRHANGRGGNEDGSDSGLWANFIPYVIDAIGFFMREDGQFCEMEADVVRTDARTKRGSGYLYARVTVKIADPEHGHHDPPHADETGPQPHNESETSASEVFTVRRKRGTSPRTWDSDIFTEIEAHENTGGGVDVELDMMATLMLLGRVLLEQRRRASLTLRIPPDKTVVKALPPPARVRIRSEYLLEALVDLVEWQYATRKQTGSFQTAAVRVQRRQRSPLPSETMGAIEVYWTSQS